jgi:hypothetical protein
METLTGWKKFLAPNARDQNKTKRNLVPQEDYSSTANNRAVIPTIFQGYLEFFAVINNFYLVI